MVKAISNALKNMKNLDLISWMSHKSDLLIFKTFREVDKQKNKNILKGVN